MCSAQSCKSYMDGDVEEELQLDDEEFPMHQVCKTPCPTFIDEVNS